MATIYLIRQGEQVKIEGSVFSTGDTYVVDAGNQVWIWIGNKSTVDERFAGAFLSDLRDREAKGAIDVDTIHQGEEPKEFRVAVGSMRIVDKDLAESWLKKVVKEVHEPVLYRISSEEFETLDDIQFIQVPRKRSSLDSEDVFLLDNYDVVYIWQGSNASVREKVVGGRVARKFDHERVGYQRELFVEEGDEPDEFTKLIDG